MGKSKDLATGAAYQDQTESDTRYVNVSGDTMTGHLGVGGDPVPSASNYNNAVIHARQAGSSSVGSQLRLTTGATGHAAGDGSFISQWADSGLYITNQEAAHIAFSTGGSERVRIDSSGRVLTPSQPAFRAYPTSTQANVTGASQLHSNGYVWTSLFNIGNHFNNSGTFTAPVAGRYVFIGHWTVYGADSNFGDAAYHMFIKNNNTGGNNGSYATSGMSMWDARGSTWDQLYTGFGGSAIMNLAANDAVTMYGGVLDGGGNNLDLVGSNVWYTTIMSGYLIG